MLGGLAEGVPSRDAPNLLANSLLELSGPCVILARAPSPPGRRFVQALGPRVILARGWLEDFSDLGRTDAEGGTCDVFFRSGLWMFLLGVIHKGYRLVDHAGLHFLFVFRIFE